MIIDPFKLPPRDSYQLLISSVVPRPIAWVSTLAEDGSYNLAPFSYFMAVTNTPPTVAIAVNRRRGSKKDTLTNAEWSKELVLNLVVEELAEQMNATSAEVPPEIDEFELAGLTPVPAQMVRPPRVAETPVNIECRVSQIIYLGEEASQSGLIIAHPVLWHVRDDLLTPQNTLDPQKLHAIGRFSHNWYTRTHELFEMVRPGYKG